MTSYADLIAQRTATATRTIRKPLVLDPAKWDTYQQAKADLMEALRVAAVEQATGADRKTKLNTKSPSTLAREAMEAAEADLHGASLWLHFRIPSALEGKRIVDEVNDTAKGDGPEWNIAYLAAHFDHATTLDGESVDDFDADALRTELGLVTAGVLADMTKAITDATQPPSFPTSLR